MATGQLSGVLHQLCRAALRDGGPTDGELLQAFVAHADAAAFAELVRRHGPMVLGVCRRVLGHAHDAEDAFQATFLVLARRAAAVRPRELVGNWLYGVAFRTALKARARAAKRRARERQVTDVPTTEAADAAVWRDLQPLLDEEVNRLPDKYRVPVVLCDLEGRSQRDAARHLGWPEGTLTTRLARARRLLAKRLTRRGVALSAAALAVTLAQQAAAATVPAALVGSTVQAATLVAAGQAATAVVSAEVAALTQGVLQAMFVTKLKSALLVLLTVALCGAGSGLLVLRGPGDTVAGSEPAAQRERKPADNPATPAAQREGGREGDRKPATYSGKVVEVAKDGKSFTVLVPAGRGRDEEPAKHTIKVTDQTKITFSGVGPGGAKLTPDYFVHVWVADGAKDVAATLHVSGSGDRNAADVSGKVVAVSADGNTLTFRMPPKTRDDEGKSFEVKLTAKTTVRYSHIDKGGTRPTEGYTAEVWFERGSRDAARVHFNGGNWPRGERGVPEKRADGAGRVVGVAQDGKTVTVQMSPRERGGEPTKQDYKIDAKTRVSFLNVGPNGDKVAEGFGAMVWLADGSTDRAEKVQFVAPEPAGHVLHGKVVGVDKGDKGINLELPPVERGGEGKQISIQITDKTQVLFNGVGPDGARLTEGYRAQVWLQEGSTTTAARVVLSAGDGR
jgi:RNA polymerase sigma factor (sigma-70 family)